MQKPSSRIGRVGNRSAEKIVPKKVTLKKTALKRTASQKPTAKKRVSNTRRIRINRLSRPFVPWENRTETLETTNIIATDLAMTVVEDTMPIQSPPDVPPMEHEDSAISAVDAPAPEAALAVVQESTSLVPSRSFMLCENQTYVIQTPQSSTPHSSMASSQQFWKQALGVTMKIPPALLSLLGWRTSYAPISQERLALQMLILNGSVRASNVEFRYSTSQEEAKSLSRSFAVLPPPDRHHLTPLQKLRMRLHAGGTQFIQRLYTQHAYARLHSRGMQLFERIRRELTIRSYLSRI